MPTQASLNPKRQLSHSEWEELKPLIQRWYIDENRTFKNIASLLEEHCTFLPTKHQFTRRLEKWGFKKNASQHEHRKIAASLGDHDRKRLRANVGRVPRVCPDVPSKVPYIGPKSSSSKSDNAAPNPRMPVSRQIHTFCPSNSRIISGHGTPASGDILSSLVQNYPTTIDVFQLFNWIENSTTTPLELTQYITSVELSNISSSSNPGLVDDPMKRFDDHETYRLFSAIKRQSPFKPFAIDLFFPSGHPGSISLHDELYPFPQSPSPSHTQKSESKTAWVSLQLRANRLEKLKQLLPRSHPAFLDVLLLLAATYLDMESLELAESLYKDIVGGWKREKERNLRRILQSEVDLIHCITRRGRHQEAASMHGPVHSTILANFDPMDELVALSLGTISIILFNQGRFREAEGPRRQQLQIRLTTCGPKDPQTIATISLLGDCLAETEDFTDGEQLLQTALQLHGETTQAFGVGLAKTANCLTWLLRKQKKYRESTNVGKMMVEKAVATLGEEHPVTLRCSTELGISLRHQGLLNESKSILERTVEREIEVLEPYNTIALYTMYELGSTLARDGRHQEGARWFEKVYQGNLEVQGPEDRRTAMSCNTLGHCYKLQGRFSDALLLYQQFIDKIRGTASFHRSLVEDILGYIDELIYLCETADEEA